MNICETSRGEEAAPSSQDGTENVNGIDSSEKVELDLDKVKESVVYTSGEEATTSAPEETCGNAAVSTASSKDVHEQSASHQESVVFDLDVDDHNEGTSRLSLETPEREGNGSTRREEEEIKKTVPPEDQCDHASYKEHLRLHQELSKERDQAIAHGGQLQTRLAEHFRRNTPDEGRLVLEQPEAYESHLHLLSEMRRELSKDSASAQQQAEQLRLQCQEKQEKVLLTTCCLRRITEC